MQLQANAKLAESSLKDLLDERRKAGEGRTADPAFDFDDHNCKWKSLFHINENKPSSFET